MKQHPILVNIEATSNCPARCSMCPRQAIDSRGFLEFEVLERILSQLNPDWVWEIGLAGRGEPTLHPGFREIAQRLQATGIPAAVVTTGVRMNSKILEACCLHLDKIRLSVSSIDEAAFASVHIGLDYGRIWRNIEALAEAAAHKTVVHLVGGPAIYDSLPGTVNHLRRLGFAKMHLFPLWNRGGRLASRIDNRRRRRLMRELDLAAAETQYVRMGRLAFLLGYLAKKARNPAYCPVGDHSLSISYRGDILGCFQDFGHTSNLGTVFGHCLQEVLATRAQKLGSLEVCRGCDGRRVALIGDWLNPLPALQTKYGGSLWRLRGKFRRAFLTA